MDLGIDHPQNSGEIEHMPCEVVFHIMIPDDLESCPYVLFTSHGVHTHPPPPPNKPPKSIMEDIVELVRRIHNPDMTLGKIHLRN